MRRARTKLVEPAIRRTTTTSAQARTGVLVLVCFLLGLALGAFFYHRVTRRSTVGQAGGHQLPALSDGTKAALRRLDSPVEIRFYSLLDPASVHESVKAFAGRADQLLSAYQQEANGRINVNRYNAQSDADARAASSDGIEPFNRDKGEVCYLGLIVAQNNRKETMPRLSPEWEAALESDLSRMIARVAAAKPQSQPPTGSIQSDTAAIQEVKRAIPNYASVSVEEGTQILRRAVLEEFKAAAMEMEAQLNSAQQRLSEAQPGKSEVEQQAAMKQLQDLQAANTEKLKEIAARCKAQIEALEQLKKK